MVKVNVNIPFNLVKFELLKKFFHDCEVALPLISAFPIRLVFLQHLNSLIAYRGSPPKPSNHTQGQFLHLPSYPLLKITLIQSLTARSPERGFSTSITLALHLAQSHCTCITKHGQHI